MITKQKRPLCGGAVKDNGDCVKCGVSYFRMCETERSKEISHISILALIAAAVAAVFS